jgi:hypothetical protein
MSSRRFERPRLDDSRARCELVEDADHRGPLRDRVPRFDRSRGDDDREIPSRRAVVRGQTDDRVAPAETSWA